MATNYTTAVYAVPEVTMTNYCRHAPVAVPLLMQDPRLEWCEHGYTSGYCNSIDCVFENKEPCKQCKAGK